MGHSFNLRRLLVGLAGLLAILGIGLASAGSASAYTTAPTLAENTSCHPTNDGDGSCVIHFTNIPSSGTYYAAIFVSSDGPFSAAQTIQAQEGGSSWTLAVKDSYESGDTIQGYAGIFTRQISAGNHDVTVSQSTHVNQFLAVGAVFGNSSGFENAAATHTDTANPSISLTASQSNEWRWCVAHDWTADQAVYTGSSGNDVFQYLGDATNGDTMAVYNGTSYTSGSGSASCGVGTDSWSGDADTIAGLVVKGS